MIPLERIGFHLLRRSGYHLIDIWDSWRLVLANKDSRDDHALTRRINAFLLMQQLKRHCCERRVDLVIDVGACEGDFAAKIRLRGYAGEIICVEPNPELHSQLLHRFAADAKWRLEAVAVGKDEGSMELAVPKDKSFASALHFSDDAKEIFGSLVQVARSFKVPKKALSRMIAELEAATNNHYFSILLKSDTQGMDQEVLESLGPYLHRVEVLTVEVPVIPVYKGTGSLPEHLDYYTRMGFAIAGCYPVSWTARGEVVEFDFLFVKERSIAGT